MAVGDGVGVAVGVWVGGGSAHIVVRTMSLFTVTAMDAEVGDAVDGTSPAHDTKPKPHVAVRTTTGPASYAWSPLTGTISTFPTAPAATVAVTRYLGVGVIVGVGERVGVAVWVDVGTGVSVAVAVYVGGGMAVPVGVVV